MILESLTIIIGLAVASSFLWVGTTGNLLLLANGLGTLVFLVLLYSGFQLDKNTKKTVIGLWIGYLLLSLCFYFKNNQLQYQALAHEGEVVEAHLVTRWDWLGILTMSGELVLVALLLTQFRQKEGEKESSAQLQTVVTGLCLGLGLVSLVLLGVRSQQGITFSTRYQFVKPVALETKEAEFHQHFDVVIILNDVTLDLSQKQYQSGTYTVLDPKIHLHDGNGQVTHLHRPGITISNFLRSLGMNITEDCFITDTQEELCQDDTNQLAVVVNGQTITNKAGYIPQDLDRVLIYYGSVDANLQSLAATVGNDACIYSLKCPERGTPPTESCLADPNQPCIL